MPPDMIMLTSSSKQRFLLKIHSRTFERGGGRAHSVLKSGRYHDSGTVLSGGVAAPSRTCPIF